MGSLRFVVGRRVGVSGFRRSVREGIKDHLTIPNPVFQKAVKYSGINPAFIKNVEKYIEMYDEKGKTIYVPRGYVFESGVIGKDAYDALGRAEVIDKRIFCDIEEPYPDLQVSPRKEQQVSLDQFRKDILAEDRQRPLGTYLNVMEVAAGKTIGVILMAMQLEQKTLIFTHTSVVMNAWIHDLMKAFGEEYKEKIGIIRGPKATLGPHFTVAMAQTWFKRQEHWKTWEKNFGCVVFDECHVCPARTFLECVNQSPAAYRIGITGTPKRKDGMHKVMYRVFGTAFYSMEGTFGKETENSLPIADAELLKLETRLPKKITRIVKAKIDGRFVKKKIRVPPDGERDYKVVLDVVTESEERTEIIAQRVYEELKADKSNSVLVVTHRVAHAKALRKAIKRVYKKGVAIMLGGSRKKVEKYENMLRERKLRCVVATMQLIKSGASIPPLNRLFITTTVGGEQDLEQVVGRIRRKAEKKKDAKIIHCVDWEIPMCRRHFIKRAVPLYRDKLNIPRYRDMYIA